MTLNAVTVKQASTLLSLSERAIQHRILKGLLQATKIGEGRTSAYLIPQEEIDRVLQERAEGGAE